MGSSTLKILGLFLLLVVIISLTTFGMLKSLSPSSTGGMSEEQIEEVVENFIIENPEVIIESLTEHQKRSQARGEEQARKMIEQNKQSLENDPTSPVAGNPDGDITIVEFFDYSCGYCKKAFPDFMKVLDTNSDVKIVFKEFPILGPNSTLAAKAAIATHMLQPEKYLELHKKLMQTRISGKEHILNIAEEIGLNKEALSSKMDSSEVNAIIRKNKVLASQIGINGTPAFVINGKLIPGAIDYDAFEKEIKEARDDLN